MGFGTGAAIGIQIAHPEGRVVHIAGDGSFRMNCNELCTIQRYGLPIVIVLVNNGTLGNVRVWQKLFYEKRYSHTTLDFGPDWEKLADAYGIGYIKAGNNQEFDTAFKKAFDSKTPYIVDARVDIDEMILPMAIPGKPGCFANKCLKSISEVMFIDCWDDIYNVIHKKEEKKYE